MSSLEEPVMERKAHWENVYSSKQPSEVSWYQLHPEFSLELAVASGVGKEQPIIDVGGGASKLIDKLLEAGYGNLSVLDISVQALRHAQSRLGPRAVEVAWLEADVTGFVPPQTYALWHDRAVFHFLTEAADRRKYLAVLAQAVPPGGHVIIATFAPDGPEKCSGLPIVRYDVESICQELGAAFDLRETRAETHRTPAGKDQKFNYFRFLRRSA